MTYGIPSHGHVITLEHRGARVRARCRCGAFIPASHQAVVAGWILEHRRRHFPRFRG